MVEAAAASVSTQHPWVDTVSAWIMADCTEQSEAHVLEQQMLNAGILASLEDAPENSDGKVEVPKSSVSSLRLVEREYHVCPVMISVNFYVKTYVVQSKNVEFTLNSQSLLSVSSSLRRWASPLRKL